MSAATIPKLLAVEDLERLPDPPGGRHELPPWGRCSCELCRHRAQASAATHSTAARSIEYAYRPVAEHEVWSADVAFVIRSREDSAEKWLVGSPELVVEVRSPSTTRTKLQDKAMTALAGGCLEFRIVESKPRMITVYSKTDGMHVYAAGQSVPLSMFGSSVDVDAIFANRRP